VSADEPTQQQRQPVRAGRSLRGTARKLAGFYSSGFSKNLNISDTPAAQKFWKMLKKNPILQAKNAEFAMSVISNFPGTFKSGNFWPLHVIG
jgi:hypothetical protein